MLVLKILKNCHFLSLFLESGSCCAIVVLAGLSALAVAGGPLLGLLLKADTINEQQTGWTSG